jgi:outer membrane protein assembly factor BamA
VNPSVDEGVFHVADLALAWDTRTDPLDPWSGWLINADVEHGRGTIETAASSTDPRTFGRTGRTLYTRGFFDVRRYNRLGPGSQLNMRVVVGGWLDGDRLPLERRFSVDGPGVLPGFDFRGLRNGRDVGTCTSGLGVPGGPAECERIALGQIEYRGDLHVGFTDNLEDYLRQYLSAHGGVAWVLFADAGRGWLVGPKDGGLSYPSGTLPPVSTFRSDLGIGIDFAGIGIYAAKSVSTPSEPVNFFVRLRHRF